MDYLCLKAAVAEARGSLVGKRFSGVRMVNPREVLLSFGKNGRLLLSIDPNRPGMYLPPQDVNVKGTRAVFTDLLTARLGRSSLKDIKFLISGDRVVLMDFAAGWPHREGESCSLVLEVMGRHSNLLLLDQDGKILGPLKPVPKSKSRIRPIVSGTRWVPPPKRDGVPIDNATAKDVPDPAAPDAVGILVNHILGLSPRVARLALNRTGEKGKEGLAAALDKMLRESDGTVGYIKELDGHLLLCPFSVEGARGDSIRKFSTFSEAAWQWKNTAGSRKDGPDEDPPDAILRDLSRVQDRIERELDILNMEEKRCLEHDTVRLQAETLLINAEDVRPGSEHVTLTHPVEGGESVSVNLDPSKNVRENTDHLFRLARRLRRGLEEVKKRKSLLADSRKELERVKSELAAGSEKGARKFLQTTSVGLLERSSDEKGPRYPGRRYQRSGFTILVGKSATDNEKVTFEAAGPHDLWLHTRDYPGSHVVILTGKKNPPPEVIHEAARLAIAGSGAKGDPAAEVMITERKWVQRIKGGKPGQVKVARYRSVRSRR